MTILVNFCNGRCEIKDGCCVIDPKWLQVPSTNLKFYQCFVPATVWRNSLSHCVQDHYVTSHRWTLFSHLPKDTMKKPSPYRIGSSSEPPKHFCFVLQRISSVKISQAILCWSKNDMKQVQYDWNNWLIISTVLVPNYCKLLIWELWG